MGSVLSCCSKIGSHTIHTEVSEDNLNSLSEKSSEHINGKKSPSKKLSKGSITVQSIEEDTFYPNLHPVEPLTDHEKKILTESWNFIEGEAERVGAMHFSKLFEKHPPLPIDELMTDHKDDFNYDKLLRNHGFRVLNTISKMIHRLDTEKKMHDVVQQTGCRHMKYRANTQFIDVMCPHFITAISDTLKEDYTSEVELAYKHLLQLLAYDMKYGLQKAQHDDR